MEYQDRKLRLPRLSSANTTQRKISTNIQNLESFLNRKKGLGLLDLEILHKSMMKLSSKVACCLIQVDVVLYSLLLASSPAKV